MTLTLTNDKFGVDFAGIAIAKKQISVDAGVRLRIRKIIIAEKEKPQ